MQHSLDGSTSIEDNYGKPQGGGSIAFLLTSGGENGYLSQDGEDSSRAFTGKKTWYCDEVGPMHGLWVFNDVFIVADVYLTLPVVVD